MQSWNPKQYQANAAYVAKLGRPVLDLLAPASGERVLDLGCGDGALTREIARCGCEVVGVDSSAEMVAAARAIGLEAYVCDGAALSYTEEFDAVFTNATLHWIKLPEAVIAGVWRALRPGGRFVGEFGGCGNVATITAAIEAALRRRDVEVVSPWYFPEPEHYAALLEEAGFAVHAIDLFARPTPLPGDARGWLETFAHVYLAAVPQRDREQLISEVVADLRDRLTDNEGNWIADYVRLRFHARKPADSGR